MAITIKKSKLTLKRDSEPAPEAGAIAETAAASPEAVAAPAPARQGVPFLVTGIAGLAALVVMVVLLFLQFAENSFY